MKRTVNHTEDKLKLEEYIVIADQQERSGLSGRDLGTHPGVETGSSPG
jgi:hypothetical protein